MKTIDECDHPPKCRIGVQVRGVYDGVLFYRCAKCGERSHRFDEIDDSRLYKLAEPYVDAGAARAEP